MAGKIKKPVAKAGPKPKAIEPETEEVVEAESPTAEPTPGLAPEPTAHAALDETVPGGRYLVNGVIVNANGEPV